MRIAALYSFNNGEAAVKNRYPDLTADVYQAIKAVDAAVYITTASSERPMVDRIHSQPQSMDSAFKAVFAAIDGWAPVRIPCTFPTDYYVEGYNARAENLAAYREIDFVKDKLGVEVQFGKPAAAVCSVCAKMTIFHNRDIIDHGIEIVPVKAFAEEMSTGVSYFEQFVWDLRERGVSNIDIPVLILGIDADP